MLSKLNSHISFRDCRFNIGKCRERTARVALWREIRIPQVFTLEASFFGYRNNDAVSGTAVQRRQQTTKNQHFQISDYLNIGRDVCICIYNILREEACFQTEKKGAEEGTVAADGSILNKRNSTLGGSSDLSKMLEELKAQKEILAEQDKSSSSASDSNPSEDELCDEELLEILPKGVLSKNQRRLLQEREDEKGSPKKAPPALQSDTSPAPKASSKRDNVAKLPLKPRLMAKVETKKEV